MNSQLYSIQASRIVIPLAKSSIGNCQFCKPIQKQLCYIYTCVYLPHSNFPSATSRVNTNLPSHRCISAEDTLVCGGVTACKAEIFRPLNYCITQQSLLFVNESKTCSDFVSGLCKDPTCLDN